jgi:uncharacterized protein YcaQ
MPTAQPPISREVARRFLVLRHLLAPPRSLPARASSVMRVFDRFGSIQFDPLDIAGRNHDLVLLARVAGYRREWTDRLLYKDRTLYETYNKGLSLVPTAELPWYRVTWDKSRENLAATFDTHAPLVEELLSRIRENGPLRSGDVGPRETIDWYWRPTNQVRAILEGLAQSGILGISDRNRNLRIYDLAERLFPPELLAERHPERDQRKHRLLSRYRAHGLLGTGGQQEVWIGTTRKAPERHELRLELIAEGALVPVEVEGVRGERFIVSSDLDDLERAKQEVAKGRPAGGRQPGVAFLAALDPLVWDRDLLRRLFDFDYLWEVYVPEATRRWGYYVQPVLSGDRLVGRIDPKLERRVSALRVHGLWWEAGFDPLEPPGFVAAFANALAAHRDFGDATAVVFSKEVRHRPFVTAVRGALEARRTPAA